jgi:mitotic spindle assembly checkpoint protein MAD1
VFSSELAEANKESVQLTAKIDTLEQRLFELGAQIAGGNHVPPNTRVIQLQQNPASEHFNLRREELNRLKAENEALLAQIAELERGGAAVSGSGMVPRESWDNMRLEKEGLIETVAQKEKRLMRLKEVCSCPLCLG